jgi:hypothetical protein
MTTIRMQKRTPLYKLLLMNSNISQSKWITCFGNLAEQDELDIPQ